MRAYIYSMNYVDLFERLVKGLEEMGLEVETSMSYAHGQSFYAYVSVGGQTIKHRVSDHSTGERRMMAEVHVYNEDSLERALNEVGYRVNPNAYALCPYVNLNKINTGSVESLDGLTNVIKAEPFTSKKGKQMWMVTRYTETFSNITKL